MLNNVKFITVYNLKSTLSVCVCVPVYKAIYERSDLMGYFLSILRQCTALSSKP